MNCIKTIILLLFLVVFGIRCSAQRAVVCMKITDNNLHNLLSDLISRESTSVNVILLNVKYLRDSVFVSLVPVDSNSVSQYLGKSIRKVVGAFEFQNRMVLVFGRPKCFFESTSGLIKIPFLKKIKKDNRFVPIPIDAFAITYLYNNNHFDIYLRYMSLFGQ